MMLEWAVVKHHNGLPSSGQPLRLPRLGLFLRPADCGLRTAACVYSHYSQRACHVRVPTMRSVEPRRSAVCELWPAFISIIHSGRATCAPLRCGPWDRGGLRSAFIPIIHSGLPTGSPYESHQSRYTALVTFASWPAASMARTKDGGMSSFFRDWPMRRPRMTPLLL